ncbi:unnamed protein product [Sympodiomycopsis kandeliae]
MAFASSSTSSGVGGMDSWDSKRRKARALESQLDAKLTAYSSIASAIARGERDNHKGNGGALSNLEEGNRGSGGDHRQLESQVEDLLSQLSESISSLSQLLDDPELPPSTVQLHAVQRHRDVLNDFERDFRRCRNNVRHAIDRYELVGRVRDDIESYKASHASDQEALLAERGRLDNSHSMIDGTLEQAYATLTDFQQQRQILSNVSNRMNSTLSQIPALNGVMTMIGRRRRRDSVIMGIIIGTLTLLLLMYITR